MSRELLYRTVLRGSQESQIYYDYDTSPMGFSTMSPVSSLAQSLSGATLTHTPKKRLSLSSNLTETPPQSLSFSGSSTEFDTSQLDIENQSITDSPISISPKRSSPINKENIVPYFSPSHYSLCSYARRAKPSPLREIQATASRNLCFSPLKKLISPSKTLHLSPVKKVSPLLECDSSSRDSGYSESIKKQDGLPRPCIPTRKLNLDQSPPKVTLPKSRSYERKMRSFASLSKGSDVDANLMELLVFTSEEDDREETSPSSFSSLFSAPIQSKQRPVQTPVTPVNQKLPIRRCLSMCNASTPLSSRVGASVREDIDCSFDLDTFACSTATTTTTVSFKRPQPPSDSPCDSKRRRTGESPLKVINECCSSSKDKKSPRSLISQRHFSNPENMLSNLERPRLQRHHSESHVSIMKALNKSSETSGELTGDFSSTHVLPLIDGGKHPDLKSIDVHTMADVIRGEYKEQVDYSIIDCRYPYEYEGGHISDAVNFYHPQMVLEHLKKEEGPPLIPGKDTRKKIVIFHCEFSAERGPKAQRLLRENDRWTNKDYYPALHFPETYLLEGGYKCFFDAYPEMCTPVAYIKMLDDNHSQDFKHFRSKSKSWASETKFNKRGASMARTGLGAKRLGL